MSRSRPSASVVAVHEVRVCVQHPSLVGSAGTDAYVKLWDVRARNVAMTMKVPADVEVFFVRIG